MRLVGSSKCETGRQVSFQHIRSTHNLQKSTVHLLLVSLAFIRNNSRLGSISLKEIGFTFLGRILGSRKVFVRDGLDIDRFHVNFGAGGDHIGRIDTTERDTVDFVGTRDQQETRFQGLETDDTLSAEAAGKDNDNGSRCDGFSDSGRILFDLVHCLGRLDVFRWVIAGCFLLMIKIQSEEGVFIMIRVKCGHDNQRMCAALQQPRDMVEDCALCGTAFHSPAKTAEDYDPI